MGVKEEKNKKLIALVTIGITVLVVAAVVLVTVFFWKRENDQTQDTPASGNLTANETSRPDLFHTLHTTKDPGAQQKVSCQNLAPGLATIIRGVDVTTLNFLPLDLADDLGYKHPVIDFTCNEGKTWQQNGENYDLPDQITAMSLVPGGWLSTQVQIYKDYNEVKTSMSSSAGLEATFIRGMFSASASYKKMQHSITNSSKYIEKVSAFDSATRADLKPYWELELGSSPGRYIDDILPENFESDEADYNEFIEYYGTHFIKNARFGGVISLVIETSTTYYNGKTDSQVEAQARGSFLKILKANGGYSGSTTTVDSQFESKSSKIIKYYGGNTNLLSSSGMQAWQPTVAANPWLFSGDLVPISRLISDPTKRESMERAVTNHINKALLREYERLLIFCGVKFPASFSDVQSLLSQVRSALAQTIPAQSAVDSLTNSIQNQILVPAWFKERTQLCYRWYPDDDGGQCGGGASRLLCAIPGAQTSWYRDDTDRRAGGCMMSWGITSSPGYDSWFSNVQICYRWYADGDGGQCGNGVPSQMCARVGSYTSYYRDDTDRRSGGCRMSWRIKTPNDAPMWMKNVQLCYYWYPDGDGGQCGDGVDRTLCARAGSWTAYYRDDTDRRGGGCRMSWGLVLP